MYYESFSSRTLRLILPACLAASLFAYDLDERVAAPQISSVRARVVLGLEGVANNSLGDLSIQDDSLVFSRREGPVIRVPLSAIRSAFITEEDKQVGGTPLVLGRAATPYGGGRVIGLFSHKKYDFLTLEYFDSNGGFHATIYQLNRGQGQAVANELGPRGVHVAVEGMEAKNAQ